MNKITPSFSDVTPNDFKKELEKEFSIAPAPKLEIVEKQTFNFSEELVNSFIDWTKELPPPTKSWGLSIGEKEYTFGTKGNFSIITGKAKSKKSFFLSVIVKKWLQENPNEVCLYFDTEQSIYDATKQIKRVISNNSNNIVPHSLRKYNPKERMLIIEHVIENTKNVGLIIIDGIRDLIASINDESEATMINTKLLNWTHEYNSHIITIIHQNKGDGNARGHIGTELINKAELVLSVTKDADNEKRSEVKINEARSIYETPDFSILINEQGFAEIEGVITKKKTNENTSKLRLNDISDKTWGEILSRIFEDCTGLKYAELVSSLKVDLETEFAVAVGLTRVKEIVVLLQKKKLIQKEGKDNSKFSKYYLCSL
jgi:hypothetical protein